MNHERNISLKVLQISKKYIQGSYEGKNEMTFGPFFWNMS